MTFHEALTRRLDKRKVRASSRKQYGYTWAQSGATENVSPDALIAWLRERVSPDAALGTVLHQRAATRHALISVYGFTEDEADDVLPPTMGRAAPPRNHLSREQLQVYLEQIRSRALPSAPRTVLLLLPYTGMRISEVCGLRAADIQYREGRRGLCFQGKGGGVRFVPLIAEAERILDAYMAAEADTLADSVWIFPGRCSDAPITAHAIRKYTREIEATAPELGRLTPHVLRHTFATLALQSSVNLREIQAILGHKDIATTAVYTHVTPGTLADSMGRIFGDEPPKGD